MRMLCFFSLEIIINYVIIFQKKKRYTIHLHNYVQVHIYCVLFEGLPIPISIIQNSNSSPDGVCQIKILVPSYAAGAIIGKGGETIAQIQKDTGSKIKMSKANDFYPGKNLSLYFGKSV